MKQQKQQQQQQQQQQQNSGSTQLNWDQLLSKSIRANRQLDFVNNMDISFIDKQNNPSIEQILFGQLLDNKSGFISPLDKRGKSFQNMKNNKIIEILWYFPLSKEKYKIKCNFDYVHTENLKDKNEYLQNVFQKYWEESIDKESKKVFQNPHPDTQTQEIQDLNSHSGDLDRYNPQDKNKISNNFTILVLTPFELEHTIFSPPQVIADARTPKFESLFKPYKTTKKYLHIKKNDGEWEIKPLNP